MPTKRQDQGSDVEKKARKDPLDYMIKENFLLNHIEKLKEMSRKKDRIKF